MVFECMDLCSTRAACASIPVPIHALPPCRSLPRAHPNANVIGSVRCTGTSDVPAEVAETSSVSGGEIWGRMAVLRSPQRRAVLHMIEKLKQAFRYIT